VNERMALVGGEGEGEREREREEERAGEGEEKGAGEGGEGVDAGGERIEMCDASVCTPT